MKALIVIDAQNEFSAHGKRPVPAYTDVIDVISATAAQFRNNGGPIAWVRHFNKPDESPAFMPGTWGAEFAGGMGPLAGAANEKEFQKDVYGAFTGTDLGAWLKELEVTEVQIAGFYTFGCVSTTAREAIMANFTIHIDEKATGSCELSHELLGQLGAEQVKNSALLQLAAMGAIVQ